MSRPKVFIAGPMYSSGSMGENIRKAVAVAEELQDAGFQVFLPHLYFFWDLMRPRKREFWTELDKGWLRECDVIFRIMGESSGADAEVEYGGILGIPVCWDMAEIKQKYL